MVRLTSLAVGLLALLPPLATAMPTSLPFTGVSHHKIAAQLDQTNHTLHKRFDFGSKKVRGVNIGGWLVSEPFIKPSLYDNTGDKRVVDEYTMGLYVSNHCTRLARHWASWITEDDFKQIAAAGLNTVRIPIGYWAFDSDHAPYCKGDQFSYLTKAVGWAKNHGLKVVVDLHGAPASQNGFDNSGHRRELPGWFNRQSYRDRSKEAIETMAKRFSQSKYSGTVSSIELLNEPLTTAPIAYALERTVAYYQDAYESVRYAQGKNNPTSQAVMIQGGFQDISYWKSQLQPPTYENVVLDHHQYTIFTPDQIAWSHNRRLQEYCTYRDRIADVQNNLWTVVGEWTSTNNDCTKYLNGRGRGARYDGTFPGSTRQGSCSSKTGNGAHFSNAFKTQLKDLFDTQRDVYETGSGWIYWTWKTESASEWSYQDGLKYGWITKNLNKAGNVKC